MAQRQRIQAVGSVSSKPRQAPSQTRHDSVIDTLYQQGSARIRFPHHPPGALQAVLLNTAGGLTGDDHIEWNITATEQSRLSVSTAACEKIYRTHGPVAIQKTRARVDVGARLDWLPQETILFSGSALQRSLYAEVDAEAEALFVESLVFGRQAMQETMNKIHIRDRWRIYCNGKLLHAEELKLIFDPFSVARQQGALHQFSAISTLLLVSTQSQEALQYQADAINQLIECHRDNVVAATSVLSHRIIVRVLAQNSFCLRKFLIPCVELLSDGAPIPPVWNV